jgi:hypothetical protein
VDTFPFGGFLQDIGFGSHGFKRRV